MNAYRDYMDAITLSPREHAALMAALTGGQPAGRAPRRRPRLGAYAALCACCALILAAAWGLPGLPGAPASPLPGQVSPSGPGGLPPADPNAVVLDPSVSPDPILRDGPADPKAVHPGVHIPQVTESGQPVQDVVTVPVRPGDPAITDYVVPSVTDGQICSVPRLEGVEALTLEEARAGGASGGCLPAWVPAGFSFQEASRGPDQDQLSALWSRGCDDIRVTVRRPAETPETMDVSRTELYDVRLYEIPWADSVPQEARDAGFDDPVFRAEDLTDAVIAARGLYVDNDAGDAAGYRFRLSVLHADGLLVSYTLKGVTPEEAARLVLGDG